MFHIVGMQGLFGNNSSPMPPLGTESEDGLYLLAKRMTLERQRSMSNPYPFWTGRDAAPPIQKADMVQDAPMPRSNILSSIVDNPRPPHLSQNTDYISVLQGLSDRPTSGVNSGVSGRSNFPVQGGLDSLTDKPDMHNGQIFPLQASFGIPQLQNQPPLTNLLAPQGIDNPSATLTPEKLLASGLSQDPQLLSLLQQQYLMQQLHSQSPVPAQQLSLLDKLLLLKQQQKQEQQQLLRQQQQLLSQALSGHHSHQRFVDQPYGQLQATNLPAGNASMDPRFPPSQELFQIASQVQLPNVQDEHVTNFVSLPPSVSHDVGHNVGSDSSSIHLPHQMFGNVMNKKSWGATLPEQTEVLQQTVNTLPQIEVVNKYPHEQVLRNNFQAHELEARVPLEGTVQNEVPMPEQVNDLKFPPSSVVEELQVEGEQGNTEPSDVKEAKTVGAREVKKTSEKKSKKQKSSSKAQSSDQAKGISKTQQSKEFGSEGSNLTDAKSEKYNVPSGEILSEASLHEARESKYGTVSVDIVEPQQSKSSLPEHIFVDDGETVGSKVSLAAAQLRAWKPAPGLKPKSLLEIQQEEQRKAEAEAEMAVSEISTSLSNTSFSTPWAGVVANSDNKSFRGIQPDAAGSAVLPEGSLNQKSKKSQLHNLLAEEALPKSNEREIEVPDVIPISMPPLPVTSSQSDLINDNNFIEAKDTKKSRKKSAKAKNVGTKVTMPVASVDVPVEKGKSSRTVQQKEVLPAVPSGPSLGDFVVWKGETANPSYAPPAWSTDSGKVPKPTSLRDILKEQGKKGSSGHNQNPNPIPQKSQPTQPTRGSGPSWSGSTASSPAKAASPIQTIAQPSTQSKQKLDDDFFWGPVDQVKQDAKQYESYP